MTGAAGPGERADAQPFRYAAAVRRHCRMFAAVVAVCVAGAGAFTLLTPKKYEAETDLLVTAFDDPYNAFVGIDLLRDKTTSVYTAGRLLTTPQALDAVNKKLGLGLSRDELLARVKVQPIQQSNVVSIVAKTESAAESARIANTMAKVLIAQRRQAFQRQLGAAIARVRAQVRRTRPRDPAHVSALEDRLAQLSAVVGSPDPTLDVLSGAVPATTPVSPNPKLDLLVGLLAGLLLGTVAVLVRDLLDPRLRDDDERLGASPVLAVVPRAAEDVVQSYLHGKGQLPPELWEGYRTLRASLGALESDLPAPRSLLVTSAIQGEGKTMTASNLAIVLAAGGMRVILVDGDLRHPMVASVFDVEPPPVGLTTLLHGSGAVDEALVPAPGYHSRLRLVLPGGGRVDLLDVARVGAVLAALKEHADVVVVDSPAVTEFADAHVLADAVDAVLVAVRLGHTREDPFDELRRFLTQHGIAPAGFVVTARERSGRSRTGSRLTPRSEPAPGAAAGTAAGSGISAA